MLVIMLHLYIVSRQIDRLLKYVLRCLTRMLREFISLPAAERLLFDAQEIPQAQRLKMIVGKIMDLPTDHPAVAQGCIYVLAPMQIMIIGQPTLFDRLYPEMDAASASSASLDTRAIAYALGGLEALSAVVKNDPTRHVRLKSSKKAASRTRAFRVAKSHSDRGRGDPR